MIEGANATGATAKGAGAAKAGGMMATAKAILLSPIFGVVALGGIIGYELWKGGKDAQEFQAAKAEEA